MAGLAFWTSVIDILYLINPNFALHVRMYTYMYIVFQFCSVKCITRFTTSTQVVIATTAESKQWYIQCTNLQLQMLLGLFFFYNIERPWAMAYW